MRAVFLFALVAGCGSSTGGRVSDGGGVAQDLTRGSPDLRTSVPDLTTPADLAGPVDLRMSAADLRPSDMRTAGDMCFLGDGGIPLPCVSTDFGVPGFDGGLPGFDFGIPNFDGGLPGFDFGLPNFDGGFPRFDFGFPGLDGGLIPCGQIPCFGNVGICMQLGCTMCAGMFCAK